MIAIYTISEPHLVLSEMLLPECIPKDKPEHPAWEVLQASSNVD